MPKWIYQVNGKHPLSSAEAPISKQQGKRKLGHSGREREERWEDQDGKSFPLPRDPRALYCFPLPSLRALFLKSAVKA